MYLAPLESTVREVTALAAKAGVRHIVDLAGAKDTWWAPIEIAVEESGVPWTHIEAGEFMPNSLMWAEQIRAIGAVRDAYPASANAMIDLDDIAAVAAVLLTEDGHEGTAYELTGPESITRAEKVRLIGEALGREVPYVELTHEQMIEELRPSMGDFALDYVDGMRDLVEHPQQALPTVAELTGLPGTTFAEWARRNVNQFR
jgi:uncharacterized protein YbjT (DUF2867 family)